VALLLPALLCADTTTGQSTAIRTMRIIVFGECMGDFLDGTEPAGAGIPRGCIELFQRPRIARGKPIICKTSARLKPNIPNDI
jgi:hypothetical protein